MSKKFMGEIPKLSSFFNAIPGYAEVGDGMFGIPLLSINRWKFNIKW